MMNLKSKIQVKLANSNQSVYIDFNRECICSGNKILIALKPQGIKILKFLCMESQNENGGIVSIEEVQYYLYGDRPEKHEAALRAMYNLRSLKYESESDSDIPDFEIYDFI